MIVGTAGHVDHGKTALVRALTGVDTDRLKEEKARGITIDLGFAYMPGPDEEPIGFVDVPGHESLVRTMVAGAAGIDVALLVVAADEGVMPQTREHLEILALLGIDRGLVVVTKSDRLAETERADRARDIERDLGVGTVTMQPPLFVSARTGEGIDRLRARLMDFARKTRSRSAEDVFRLAIDRAFTLKGVGTVVAGTALSGQVRIDDELTLLPGGERARVRSLHVQNQPAQEGRAGDRCALALAGVAKDAVARGAWVCADAAPAETTRFDATIRLLASERRALGQWAPAHLHVGASDAMARVTILSAETLPPAATGFAQIVLSAPLPLRHGDRFVLRDASAQRTIGGGKVVDPRAPLRKRRSPERLQRLAAMEIDAPDVALRRLLESAPFVEELTAFAADRSLTREQAVALADRLDLAVEGDGTFVMTKAHSRQIEAAILDQLAAHHAAHPELPGLAGDQLRRGLEPVPPKPVFAAVRARLLAEGRLAVRGHWLHLPSHVAQLSAEDRRIADLMLPLIEEERFRPPRVRDIGALIGFHETLVRRACKALARSGALIEIAPDQFFKQETVLEMAGVAQDLTGLADDGLFTAAQFRDRLDNGRKVAILILEHFDRRGLTHRAGDLRRVVKSPALVFGDIVAPDVDPGQAHAHRL